MDALTFLRQDHKSVLGMLEVLDDAPSGSGATSSGLDTMVTNLVIAESQHEAIEEQFFWPAVRELLETGMHWPTRQSHKSRRARSSSSGSRTASPAIPITRRR